MFWSRPSPTLLSHPVEPFSSRTWICTHKTVKLSFTQAAKPGLFDYTVDNTLFDSVYHGLKEAISTLSPIIRNRWATGGGGSTGPVGEL